MHQISTTKHVLSHTHHHSALLTSCQQPANKEKELAVFFSHHQARGECSPNNKRAKANYLTFIVQCFCCQNEQTNSLAHKKWFFFTSLDFDLNYYTSPPLPFFSPLPPPPFSFPTLFSFLIRVITPGKPLLGPYWCRPFLPPSSFPSLLPFLPSFPSGRKDERNERLVYFPTCFVIVAVTQKTCCRWRGKSSMSTQA